MTQESKSNRQWLLKRRPDGLVSEDNFEWRESALPVPADGEMLVKVLYLSFDPTQRGWINDAPGYMPPVQIGEPMRAGALGRVVESRHPDFEAGDLIQGNMSWQDYVVCKPGGPFPMTKVDDSFPLTWHLGLLGITGVTAYFGMLDVARPRSGDVVVVSGAAGATGSVAGQIAKLKGCTVIGIAGGPDKCRWLTEKAGFDAAIDYKNEPVHRRLGELCPGGVDVYFDNVGGDILDAVLLNLNFGARIAVCGGISSGYGPKVPPGPKYYMQLVFKSARMEGFLVLTYAERFPEAVSALAEWAQAGQIHVEEDVAHGLECAPATLRRLFEGGNLGKQLLKVTD